LTRVLALDYGRARCGCALSDPTGTIATPLDVITDPASDEGVNAIARLVGEEGVSTVVVGLPVTLSGEEGAQAKEALAFAKQLEAAVPVPVETYDERFTTKLASGSGGEAPEDSRAAAHLLESYLRARSQ
jgi:putative Holliday junction resolvase